jgi:hypothetical protein
MTITTTAHADVDLITALDAGLLDFQTPSADALAILTNTAIASGRERGIIAAQILERIVPDGVQIEEINCGRDAKARGVFLHQDDVDHIALYFFDRTASVTVHIDADEPDERHDAPVSPLEMFDLIRAYYA